MRKYFAIAALPILASCATIATAGTPEDCKTFSEAAYLGAEDGNVMAPLSTVEIIAASTFAGNEIVERLYLSVYLAGYSAGLIGTNPADAAMTFYNGCVSEPV